MSKKTKKTFSIAIDGPSGAGKSTVAKALAEKLGFIHVDTGAMYRSVGLYVYRKGVLPDDREKVIPFLTEIDIDTKYENGAQRIYLNGEDVSEAIRQNEISSYASKVSAIPEVRAFLLDLQRKTAERYDVIMDGRDIGTVILPNADLKIFQHASAEARAKRRYDELIAKGQDVSLEEITEQMIKRDYDDSHRANAPCVPADDAVIIDNSDMTIEQNVDHIAALVEKRRGKQKKTPYEKAKKLLSGLFGFLYRLKIEGAENIPKQGGYMVCSNHIALFDPVMLAIAFPHQLHFMVKTEAMNSAFGKMLSSFGCFGVKRGTADKAALRTAIGFLNNGECLGVFPQGTRRPAVDPKETEPKTGIAMIAYRTGCDIVPVFIKTKKRKLRMFSKTTVVIGEPIKNEELNIESGTAHEYKNASGMVFSDICALEGDMQ